MKNFGPRLNAIHSKILVLILTALILGFLWIGLRSLINQHLIELVEIEKTLYFWGLLCLGIIIFGELLSGLIYKMMRNKYKLNLLKLRLSCLFAWFITTTMFIFSYFHYLNIGL